MPVGAPGVRLDIIETHGPVPHPSTKVVMEFGWQQRPGCLDGYTDSDWGGCTRSHKSTSGAVIMIGKHLIKGYSKQQKVLALSSAEAETYGMVACSAEVLGI